MVIREAIPTEYDGVRYDSKSEAIFANLLTQCHEVVFSGFHSFLKGGHYWDFFCWSALRVAAVSDDKEKTCITTQMCCPTFIEYKPRKPTETYIVNLRKKFLTIRAESPISPVGLIVFGSAWDSCGYSCLDLDSLHDGDYWLGDYLGSPFNCNVSIESAKKYRYDLP